MNKLVIGVNDFETWCIKTDNQDLLKQYSTKNKIGPSNIARSSHKKVIWDCQKCGKEYEASLTHRTSKKPTGCPYCNNFGCSIPDLSIYNYFKLIYSDCRYRNKELGFELDVIIPEIKIAIEYDGIRFHGIRTGYSEKAATLQKYNYKLIRIIGVTNDVKDNIIINKNEYIIIANQNKSNHIKCVIKSIIDILNSININIDFNTDLLEQAHKSAINQLINKESINKLVDVVPDLVDYYKSELNSDIDINTISKCKHMYLNLQCKNCETIFSLHVSNILRMLSKQSEICPKCRKALPNKVYTGVKRSIDQVFINIKDFWSEDNIDEPQNIRAENRDICIKLICPYCFYVNTRIPQQMCNNNYRRGTNLRCSNCRKVIPLQVTSDRTKRHHIKRNE